MRPTITETEAEKMMDRLVWRWLERDLEYSHAENAEQQADREWEISEAVWREIQATYEIRSI